MLAAVFQRPGPDLELTIEAAPDIAGALGSFRELSFVPPAQEFLDQIKAAANLGEQTIVTRYDRLFTKTPSTGGVPLEESAFLEVVGDNSGWVLVAIERMYDSAGFAANPPPGTTSDHIGVELEFLSALCGQEVEALAEEDRKEARRIQARQLRFISSHPVKWIPYLEAVLARKGDLLFASAGQLTHSLLLHDFDLLEQTREILKAR
jgi:TorA maturation chaperone TorD